MTEFPKGAFKNIEEWRNFVSATPGGVVYHAPAVTGNGMPPATYGVQKLITKNEVKEMRTAGRHSLKFENIIGLTTDIGSLAISWETDRQKRFLFKNFWDAYAYACKVGQSKNEG